MLKLCNVSKSFENNKVLRDINLEINKGEKVVIIGPSGSGKSTLLRCMNMIAPPTEGEIYFCDKLLSDDNICEYRQKIGMVFQNFNLFNNYLRNYRIKFELR